MNTTKLVTTTLVIALQAAVAFYAFPAAPVLSSILLGLVALGFVIMLGEAITNRPFVVAADESDQ